MSENITQSIFRIHSMRFDYAGWSRQFAEQIEREEQLPDPELPA